MSISDNGADRKSYEELFPDTGEQSDVTSFPSSATVRSTGSSRHIQPAAVTSHTAQTMETFDVAGDEPDDKPTRRPVNRDVPSNITLDFVSQKLKAQNYYPDVRFDWCLGTEGRRMRFSRRYIDPHVLVDVFNNDTKSIRQEVDRKRQILLEHNAKMVDLWEENAEELQDPKSVLSFVSRGLVIMGYLPIISSRVAASPFEQARRGEVCNLPQPLDSQFDHTIGSTQLGMRTILW